MKSIRHRSRQSWIEWGFVAFLLVLCVILTALQYHWTGEVSRAEAARLRRSLAEQGQVLANAFDAELTGACAALSPSRTELRELSCVDALVARYRHWHTMNPRPIFRRVAVAVPSVRGIELFVLDEKTGTATISDWPMDWFPLREYVMRMLNGGPPRFNDSSGELLEFPLFGGRPGGRPNRGESGWLLLQLHMNYVSNIWLPELVRTHLSFAGTLPYDVTVTTATKARTLFSSGTRSSGDVDFTTRFHRGGRSVDSPPGRHGRT